MTTLLGLLILVLNAMSAAPRSTAPQPSFDFVPVGVRYDPDPDPVRRKTDLENIRRLRFTVVVLGQSGAGQPRVVFSIDRLLAGEVDAGVAMQPAEIGRIQVEARGSAATIREQAWTFLTTGALGVIFDDWKTLQQNDAALTEAAAFAEVLALNPALYTPLRLVEATGDRAIAIEGGDNVNARWLESADAMLLIAVNHADAPREVTLTFPPAIPEAVWQNMLSGTSVNFVAGPSGPVYRRTFAAHDVLVLMIRKRWK